MSSGIYGVGLPSFHPTWTNCRAVLDRFVVAAGVTIVRLTVAGLFEAALVEDAGE